MIEAENLRKGMILLKDGHLWTIQERDKDGEKIILTLVRFHNVGPSASGDCTVIRVTLLESELISLYTERTTAKTFLSLEQREEVCGNVDSIFGGRVVLATNNPYRVEGLINGVRFIFRVSDIENEGKFYLFVYQKEEANKVFRGSSITAIFEKVKAFYFPEEEEDFSGVLDSFLALLGLEPVISIDDRGPRHIQGSIKSQDFSLEFRLDCLDPTTDEEKFLLRVGKTYLGYWKLRFAGETVSEVTRLLWDSMIHTMSHAAK